MFSKVKTCILNGLEGTLVEVETDISKGIPTFSIVGLGDTAIKESKERVRSAISNSEYEFPLGRIVTNLVPANYKKEGTHLDLPIAVGILKGIGIINSDLEGIAFLGELSLDGKINKVEGVLPSLIFLREVGVDKVIIPFENRKEGDILSDYNIVPVKSLTQLVNYLSGKENIDIEIEKKIVEIEDDTIDFKDVKGQDGAKRAIEICAAGFHNILIIGPRGVGKSMLAKRIPTIMPKLSLEESIEITKIYSIAGMLEGSGLIQKRPFRSPHHTISTTALSGGGRIPKPGELSLSHRGILFMDELPEFKKTAIEVLRQPLEDKEVSISRVNGKVKYPSDIMLVAAMNPCSCGNYGTESPCTCSQTSIDRYLKKISGPVLDRIDLHIEVGRVKYDDLEDGSIGESSEKMRKRVEKVRLIQKERLKDESINFNSQMNSRQVEKYCKLNLETKEFLKEMFEKLDLSARAYDKILKIARTIADLEDSSEIELIHIAEVIQYRSLDRKYWK